MLNITLKLAVGICHALSYSPKAIIQMTDDTGKHLYIALQKEAVSQLKENKVRTQNEEIIFY